MTKRQRLPFHHFADKLSKIRSSHRPASARLPRDTAVQSPDVHSALLRLFAVWFAASRMTAVQFRLLSADRKNCLFPAARSAHCLLTDRRSKCSWLNPEKNGRIKNTNLRAAVFRPKSDCSHRTNPDRQTER